MLTGALFLWAMVPTQDGIDVLTTAQRDALAMEGRWQGAALLLGSFPAVGVLWLAIREVRRDFSEYLALKWPTRDQLVGALMITTAFVAVEAMFVPGGGMKGVLSNPYLSVGGAGGLFILLVAGCIAGPIMEEFIFRGFLFRGWSQSGLGPIGAIALISIIWGAIHTQYDWVVRFWIFLSGLILGHFRWRSNSTWLTVIVHSAMNIGSFFTMGKYI